MQAKGNLSLSYNILYSIAYTSYSYRSGVIVANKRVSPHSSSCTIRLTEQEKKKILEYSTEHGFAASEYFRCLARTHLKMNPEIDKIESAA